MKKTYKAALLVGGLLIAVLLSYLAFRLISGPFSFQPRIPEREFYIKDMISSESPLAINPNVEIESKGEQEIQVGFYNNGPGTRFNLGQRIINCKDSDGEDIAAASLPVIENHEISSMKMNGTEVWKATITLPRDSSLAAGGYVVCRLGIYGTGSKDMQPDMEKDTPLGTKQFFIKVR